MSVDLRDHTASSGLIVSPHAHSLLADARGNAQRAMPAPETALRPPKQWACRSHARQAHKRGIAVNTNVGSIAWLNAMLFMLLGNKRFATACGWNPTTGAVANVDRANELLARGAPICCRLSAPERWDSFAFALHPEQLNTQRAARLERAERRAHDVFIQELAVQFALRPDDAAYVASKIGDRALLVATLSQARRDNRDPVAAVDDIAGRL